MKEVYRMLALNIPELKNFMNQLLCSDTFDHFLLKEGVSPAHVVRSCEKRLEDAGFEKIAYE